VPSLFASHILNGSSILIKMSGTGNTPTSNDGFRPFSMNDRVRTSHQHPSGPNNPTLTKVEDVILRGRERQREGSAEIITTPVRCINPASDVNSRLDTQVEVRVYPCNNSQGGGKKKFTTFTIKPEVCNIVSVQRLKRILLTECH
jgi:hypothetical protein